MANSTDNSLIKIEYSSSPPERKIRRRLVQSMLIPCKAPEDADVGDCLVEGDEVEDDREEARGSRGKKRKRKIQPKASNNVSVAIKKSPVKNVQDKNSILIARSDFFLKASEKRRQQKHQREKQADKTEENDDKAEAFVPVASKEKGQRLKKQEANITPCKGTNSSCHKGTEGSKTPCKSTKSSCNRRPQSCQANGLGQSVDVERAVFDLHLEAKLAVEENAQLSSGKQIHPFFSSWKVSKRSQEVIEIDDTVEDCPSMQVGLCNSCPPFHIYERHQDDLVSLDWKDWNFSKIPTFDSRLSCDLANSCSRLCEGYVEPLTIDTTILISCGPLSPEKEVHLNKVFNEGENNHVEHALLPAFSNLAKQDDKIGLPFQFIGSVCDKEDKQEAGFLLERTTTCHVPCGSWPRCGLWTNKYRPEKALEVCGNSGPVKYLSEWLQSWHESVPQASASSVHDSECSWSQSDSDLQDMDEGSPIKNVFLVTGPVGSGKSAAVYACAKEHDFEVIEVSASDCRNGVTVKQKFGEAMESHGFNEWPHGSQRNQRCYFTSSGSNRTATQDFDAEVVELASNTCGQPKSVTGRSRNSQERRTLNKSLILFEDVDIVFDEDRGLIGTILQLAETAKRPMILTCNSKDPSLPHVLERLVVDFKLPSVGELLSGVHMVCAAERLNLSSQILERFVWYCQGDIRKTIMLLQFWCQGGQAQEGMEMKFMYSPLQFDIDAGHLVLPRLMPWGFSHELSTVVEREISKFHSLAKREDLNFDTDCSGSQMDKSGIDEVSAKKEIMLRRNCEQDMTEFPSQSSFAGEFTNNIPNSPVTFPRRTRRRNLISVLSSDSGDDDYPILSSGNAINDFLPSPAKSTQQCDGQEWNIAALSCSEDNDLLPEFPSADANNHIWPNVSDGNIMQSIEASVNLELSTADKCYLAVKSGDNHPQISETARDCSTCETHNLFDVSYVPESSFVPETEICDGEESSRRVKVPSLFCDISLDDVSISQRALNVSNPKKTVSEIDQRLGIQLGKTAEVGSEPVYSDTLIGDHLIDEAEAVSRVYPVMDECSRVDFTAGFTLSEHQSSALQTNLVQEAWTMLRRSGNLKSYVTSEERVASHMIELVSKFTDLFSEADVLLRCCQPLIYDNVESYMLPLEDPTSVSWDDELLEMTSTFAQHGFCVYANRTAKLGSELGYQSKLDLAQEMLACSMNPMALGKLVKYEVHMNQGSPALQPMSPAGGISLQRENEKTVYRTIVPIVPPRLQLALKGSAFHEYLSSLSQICKSEALQLVNSVDRTKRRRRGRTASHYLSTVQQTLSPEEVQLLAQKFCFGAALPEPSCR
ncbi:uncharacterized protein [Aristolochia californica]|uniref:uncharacterized protein n=1 Tax=Aristolochia californica TaxID=171875 RepID=UPI0035E30028